ncbi:hypothetical protein ACTXJG_15990 [Glutamicibacter arilaitensis]|uniref:hypothetical protein n=1 Tax=Glutamicibacter arilaitensis TaxID=256701 RepID=UPI003FD54ABE
MIISLNTDAEYSMSLEASFDEYDGYAPTNRFVVDATPHHLSAEYLGLASYLVFGTWASGAITFPELITPELSSAIEDDSSPVRIRPQGLNLVPKRVKQGNNSILINLNGGEETVDCPVFEVLPYGINEGFLRNQNRLRVSSNAFIFSGVLDQKLYVRPIIAAALLSVGGVGLLGTIYLSANIVQRELVSLQALLQSVGVELVLLS